MLIHLEKVLIGIIYFRISEQVKKAKYKPLDARPNRHWTKVDSSNQTSLLLLSCFGISPSKNLSLKIAAGPAAAASRL